MIKNEYQYKIVKAQIRNFEEALNKRHASADLANIDSQLLVAQEQGLQSQLDELRAEAEEYEFLREGKNIVLEVDSLEKLPEALVKARIASGMSQQELAERLGLKEQQVQRYEATNYAGASMSRLVEVTNCLNIKIHKDVLLNVPSKNAWKAVLAKLKSVGLSRDFILRKFTPAALLNTNNIEDIVDSQTAAFEVAKRVSRVFGWTISSILGDTSLSLNQAQTAGVLYKLPKNVNEMKVSAYTIYAHHLALQLYEANQTLPLLRIPETAEAFYNAVIKNYGAISLENVVSYLWDLGVIVIPLKDTGVFHGACWRIAGRNIIILKQSTQLSSRWLFDLLHEVGHLRKHQDSDDLTLVEAPEDSEERRTSAEELQASRFAGNVILAGRAEDLIKLCISEAQGQIERLKRVVPIIANREKVSVEALANYLAYRLSLQGENWWGTAANLQTMDDPWRVTRDILLERSQLNRLKGLELDLLTQALTDME